MDWTKTLVVGALRSLPIVGSFAAYQMGQQRGWGTWGSALAAGGAALATSLGASVAENYYLYGTTELSMSGIRGVMTPGDVRRAGYFNGIGQRVPANVRSHWGSRGRVGLIDVSRGVRGVRRYG